MSKKTTGLKRTASAALAAVTALILGTTAFAAGQTTSWNATQAVKGSSFTTVYERYEAILNRVTDSTDKKTLTNLLEEYQDAAEDTADALEALIDALEDYDVDVSYVDNSRELDVEAIADDISDLNSSSARTKLKKLLNAYKAALEDEQDAREDLDTELKEVLGDSYNANTFTQTVPIEWDQIKGRFKNLGADSQKKLENLTDQLKQAVEKGKSAIKAAPQGQQSQITQKQNAEIQKLISELEKESAAKGVKLELPRQWHE